MDNGLHMDYQGNDLRDFFEVNGRVILQKVNNNSNLRSFTEKEIEQITHGYSTLLGKGAFGEVYKGALTDQRPVAVKKYKDGTRKEEFAKEVIVHSQLNHKNVVRLFGCCTEENTLTIVMEFVGNGSLYNILHCNNAVGCYPFPLDKRLNIAIELAEVLSYMHSMYSPVLHGDIKPANILLDENYMPKISDFGIARLLSINVAEQTMNIIGSIGYMDPLYCQTGILTPKSDVYSFGVVLVEMITRKKATDRNTNLIQNFIASFKKGKKLIHMFDEEIADGKKKMNVLKDIAKLAVECLRLEAKLRPEMIEVADRLRKNRKDLQPPWRTKAAPSALFGYPGLITKDGNIKTDLSMVSHLTSGGSFLPQPPAPIHCERTSETLPIPVLIISLAELREMTKNFSTVIGDGMFYGELKDGRKSVVKKLFSRKYVSREFAGSFSQPDEEFLLRVQGISRLLKHDNVVPLFGYCVERNTRFLVYEYSLMGSLHDILHGKKGDMGAQASSVLSWDQRVKIALSAAQGLEFLHERAEPCIIHSNITSSNIFLFDNDVAKIGNLGVSKDPEEDELDELILDRIGPRPTGYDPPEYYNWTTDGPSKKWPSKNSDVYSFGVVMLELLTGWDAVAYQKQNAYLLEWAEPRLSINKLEELMDPDLEGKYHPKCAAKMARLAVCCVQGSMGLRPTVSVIVKELQSLL